MGFKELFEIVLVFAALVAVESKDYKVMCFLGSWSDYREGDAQLLIEDIDPFLCTHAIYAFAMLEDNQIKPFDPHLDLKENFGLGSFNRFNYMKKTNPKLKTLISIGGWNDGSTKYSEMVSNSSSRAIFVKSVVDFCMNHGFDGLDMHWKYPADRGGVSEDKDNFVQLLKELKEAFLPYGYLLSAAVAARKSTMDKAYDVPQVSKYLDFIIVMAYDLHGSWERKTGHHAPLYPRPEEKEFERVLNVDYAINYWIDRGAPKEKLILGMSAFGRSYTLASPSSNGIEAPAIGPGNAGPLTTERGFLGFNEICLLLSQGWIEIFVDKIEAPYAYYGRQWVGYENKKSIGIKTKYLIEKGLGGGSIWSLENDDFRGKCNGQKFSLLSTLADQLLGITRKPEPESAPEPEPNKYEPESEPRPNKPTSTRTPSLGTVQDNKCPKERYFRDPVDCSMFYYCVQQANGEYIKRSYSCGEAAAFDQQIQTCIRRHLIPGC